MPVAPPASTGRTSTKATPSSSPTSPASPPPSTASSGSTSPAAKALPSVCHQFLDGNGVRFINIPTNAIQTDVIVSLVAAILAVPHSFRLNIAVSLDGVGGNHDRIRGVPGNYEKALATLARLREIRDSDPRLSLSVVTTVMRHNLDDVKQLLALGAEQWQLDYHSLNILRGSPMDNGLLPPTPDQFAEISRVQLEHCRRYFRSRFGPLQGWVATLGRYLLNRYYLRELEGRPKDISCNAGRISCVIDANGDVYFCELLQKVGNLNDYDWDFKRLWFDFQAQRLRRRVRRCHCTHECFHTKNLTFTPTQLL